MGGSARLEPGTGAAVDPGMRTPVAIVVCLTALTAAVGVRLDARRPSPAEPDADAPAVAAVTAQEPPGTVRLGPASLTIAAAARDALEQPPRGFRDDCSGYVTGALVHAGVDATTQVPAEARVADWWAWAEGAGRVHHNPIPVVGDLAFFDNTFDRDGNGRMDDRRTHIAIVVDVEPDGTVVLAHKGSAYALIRMNLLHPLEKSAPDGTTWNTFLRRTGDRGNPLGMYRTSELWSGFATLTEP